MWAPSALFLISLPLEKQFVCLLFLFLRIAGGSVVLLYASKYHDIGAVVNVCGRYDLKSGLERRLGANFMETLKKDGYIDVKTKTGFLRIFLSVAFTERCMHSK